MDQAALTIDAGLAMELLGALRAERREAEAAADGGDATMTVAPPASDPRPIRRARDRRSSPRGHPGRGRRDEPGRSARCGPRLTDPAAVRRGPGRARPASHRGDQAVVAVGGAIAGAGEDIVARARAYEAGRRERHLRAVRAALVRRVRGGSPGRPGGRLDPGPGQGVRRRGDPAPDAARGRRRPRPAAGQPPSGQGAPAARGAGARDRPGAARGGARCRARWTAPSPAARGSSA